MISKPKSFQTDTEKELLPLTITLGKGYIYQLEMLGFYFASTVADSSEVCALLITITPEICPQVQQR